MTLVNGYQRFTVQPEPAVTDPQTHMNNTIQGLRKIGFDVTSNDLLPNAEGYELVVSKHPLTQWVSLKKVGGQWLLITATTAARDFQAHRPVLEQMTRSIQPL